MSKKKSKIDDLTPRTIGDLVDALNAIPNDTVVNDVIISVGDGNGLITTREMANEITDTRNGLAEREVNPMNPEYDLYDGEYADVHAFINYIAEETADFVADIAFKCICFNREHRVNHLTEMCRRYVEYEDK